MVVNERINFGSVLCPIDLLPDSEEAVGYAASFARMCGASLLVCHCSEPGGKARRLPTGNGTDKNMATLIQERKLEGLSGLFDVLEVEGDPVEAIPRVAAEKRVDLIVMRSRRSHHSGALLGSITESISRTAPCPVLVTHRQDRPTSGPRLQRVLVAYDSSSDAELALSYGLQLARRHNAELHLLNVIPSRVKTEAPEIAMLPLSAEQAVSRRRLESAVSEQTGLSRKINYVVREGQPYREVLAYAEEQNVELICMGASGTGFGMNALFGSNADRVLRQARCPVLIARPLRPSIRFAS